MIISDVVRRWSHGHGFQCLALDRECDRTRTPAPLRLSRPSGARLVRIELTLCDADDRGRCPRLRLNRPSGAPDRRGIVPRIGRPRTIEAIDPHSRWPSPGRGGPSSSRGQRPRSQRSITLSLLVSCLQAPEGRFKAIFSVSRDSLHRDIQSGSFPFPPEPPNEGLKIFDRRSWQIHQVKRHPGHKGGEATALCRGIPDCPRFFLRPMPFPFGGELA